MPTAQTSKDILADAQKTLDQNKTPEMAVKDVLDTAVSDTAAYGKAKALLNGSVNSMKTLNKTIDDRVDDLNAGLTTLRKNEAVMQAPADAKAFAKLVKEYSEEIKSAMASNKKIDAQLKTSEKLL